MKYALSTKNSKETKKFGEMMAGNLKGGEIICLTGNLGSGKTIFSQGLLNGLKIKGPHTSPTFVIIKKYIGQKTKKAENQKAIFHIDAYRVDVKDILSLGWKEMISDKKNIVIVEWAERIKKIIPKNAIWINFKWIDKNKREIVFRNFKFPMTNS